MKFRLAISIKFISVMLFAMMSVLIRYVIVTVPLGQAVFFRSAFAIIPVTVIYAWRRELGAAFRTKRPLGISRGLIAVVSMFLNFAALARLPLADATAFSFAAPFITVVLATVILKERVRVYRWSAVLVGFFGVLVMLWPYLALTSIGVIRGSSHIFLTESYRYALASVAAPFDYVALLWAHFFGYVLFGEIPVLLRGRRHRGGFWPVRNLAQAPTRP